MTNTVVLPAETNIPSPDVTENDDSQRPLLVSSAIARMDVYDLDATGNFERYITGEKFVRYHLYMSSSDLSQALLLNVQRLTSTTKLSPPSSSSFMDLRTRNANF